MPRRPPWQPSMQRMEQNRVKDQETGDGARLSDLLVRISLAGEKGIEEINIDAGDGRVLAHEHE